ncbi:MAG: dethiobiotin synthase [Candidatus Berkiella sp.]
MTGIFVTATGTEIGKTYVSSHLLSTVRNELVPSKPIITGWPSLSEEVANTDSALLLKASGYPLTPKNIDWVSPWRFSLPLTPDMAALAEGREIDIEKLLDFCKRREQWAMTQHKQHLIEGVGGLMSPIWGRFTNLEWIKALNYRCILVTGSYLGSLNHTLCALKVLANEKVTVGALVVNETPTSTVSLHETCDYYKKHVDCEVIAIPRHEKISGTNYSIWHKMATLLVSKHVSDV